jgi:sigma-B regulation protein RsbU (phosphoserine phosphatase)
MKILLVENDTATGRAIEQHLQVLEHEVTACTSAETALEASQQIGYPLIILDIEGSGMDGDEFCRRIRTLRREDYSMILVLTTHDRLKDLQTTLELGADDYLLKPVTREQLHMRIKILERQQSNFTAHKRAEQALRQTRKEWEEIFQAIGQPTIILDKDHHILAANRATLNATGLTKETIKTKNVLNSST